MASVVGAICRGPILRTSDTQFYTVLQHGQLHVYNFKVPRSVFNAMGRTATLRNVSPTGHAVADLASQPNII